MAVLNFFDILTIQPDFFDDAELDERIDKDDLRMAILDRCGTLLPVYTNSKVFKLFSDAFFKRNKLTISKLIDTTEFEYNPIHNYDRNETVNRDYTRKNTTNTTENNTSNNTATQENLVSAFDASDYTPRDKMSNNNSQTDNNILSGSESGEIGENITTRTSGNIGVTTTQKMIQDERKVDIFNVYTWIAIEFEQHFFICIA